MNTRENNASAGTNRRPRRTTQSNGGRSSTSGRQGAAVKTRTTRSSASTAPKRQKQPAPEIVYTQPGPFNRNRFLLRLATVAAIVIAIVFGMSIFFKVDADKITVSGTEKYTPWQIREASGIRDGENLFTLSDAKISSKITEALPYVKRVRVGIKLPDTVNIEIEELDVVYLAEDNASGWWLIAADGTVIEHTSAAAVSEHTKILGVKLDSPVIGQKAVAAENEQPETPGTGEQTPVTVLESERLEAAISILGFMEASGIVGQAASVDVSNLSELEIWYASQYQIKLGDTTQLAYKISSAKKAIDQMSPYQQGILDVSFILKPDQIVFTEFD